MHIFYKKNSLRLTVNKRLAADAEKSAAMTFDDLPTEDEWLVIESKW